MGQCQKEANASVNSKPDHPRWANPQGFFERVDSPTPRQRESAKPLGQKNCAKTRPPEELFSKIQQKNTKHEIEIMKNSTEMLVCLEILKN